MKRHRIALVRLLGIAGIVGIVAVACVVALVATSTPAAATDDVQVKAQARAYFNLYYQANVVPANEKPGSLSAQTKATLQQRLTDLTTVETGGVLTGHIQALKLYQDALARGDQVGVYTAGSIDSISFNDLIIQGATATVSGQYTCHFDSYHLENGVKVPDGLRGTNNFTLQLTKQNGRWLASSVDTMQVDVQANYPVTSGTPVPLPSGPIPTKPPIPTSGTKFVQP